MPYAVKPADPKSVRRLVALEVAGYWRCSASMPARWATKQQPHSLGIGIFGPSRRSVGKQTILLRLGSLNELVLCCFDTCGTLKRSLPHIVVNRSDTKRRSE